jgi:hypothetical protein
MKKITKAQAKRIGDKLNVNFDIIDVETLQSGMNVELEHGKRCSITNITNDNLELTAKIALAHLLEYPNYYVELEKMEERLNKYWKNKKKPYIFL